MTIQVSLAQASKFLELGYEVSCFIDPPALANGKTKRGPNRHPQMAPDTMLGLSLNGKGPTKGQYQASWLKTKKDLWDKDMTKTYSRTFIFDTLVSHGHNPSDGSIVSYLTNKCKVLRIIKVKE